MSHWKLQLSSIILAKVMLSRSYQWNNARIQWLDYLVSERLSTWNPTSSLLHCLTIQPLIWRKSQSHDVLFLQYASYAGPIKTLVQQLKCKQQLNVSTNILHIPVNHAARVTAQLVLSGSASRSTVYGLPQHMLDTATILETFISS